MNTAAAAGRGKGQARKAARSDTMGLLARWGLAARGVIYLVVGLLALQIALGEGGEQADRNGALRSVAEQPFGEVLLWALGIGLAGLALWRLSEALFGAVGPDGHKASKRATSAVRAVIYAAISVSVLLFAAGASGSGDGDEQSRTATARALDMPGGQWLVGAAGLVLLGVGVYIGVKAARLKFREEMRRSQMSKRQRQAVDVLGVVGGVARGAVFAGAGVFVVQAAYTFDPDKAKGLDATLRSFAETPAGPVLLGAVAVGLALFGLFSFTQARWRRV